MRFKSLPTPAFCQSRNRLQQVEREPNPNFVDRSRQRIPVLSTNRMPFSAALFATGNRPGYFLRRGFGIGSNGSISAHSDSSASQCGSYLARCSSRVVQVRKSIRYCAFSTRRSSMSDIKTMTTVIAANVIVARTMPRPCTAMPIPITGKDIAT